MGPSTGAPLFSTRALTGMLVGTPCAAVTRERSNKPATRRKLFVFRFMASRMGRRSRFDLVIATRTRGLIGGVADGDVDRVVAAGEAGAAADGLDAYLQVA